MTTVEDAVGRTRRFNTRRIATRHGWTIGVYVLLVLLIIAYAWALAPVAFTSFDLASIVIFFCCSSEATILTFPSRFLTDSDTFSGTSSSCL